MSHPDRPITISLHALGGQGGGVLAEWIISVARGAGWKAQSTSVPGVAQRTGATVYYVELFPCGPGPGEEPVFALMPTPGDVDLVIASEMMEAGRAINRGLVTERTTLIASTSRIYAISEKSGMADGRIASAPILAAARERAGRLICFDMEAIATETRSVVSAVLFGAVAGSGALPFPREAFEAEIRISGKAVATNLAAFSAAYEVASGTGAQRPSPQPHRAAYDCLVAEGVKRLIDYQDRRYAEDYRRRLHRFETMALPDTRLIEALARYLALWMSYEDVVRVADLKIRSARFARVRGEVSAKPAQIVHIVEFLHPRVEEIADTVPAALGRMILKPGPLRRFVETYVAKGHHVTTTRLAGFLQLYFLAGRRSWRRKSLRFAREQAHIDDWLDRIARYAQHDHDRALEITLCQRLIKGYGETFERGWRNFERIMALVDIIDAQQIVELRSAALADERGDAMSAVLERIGSARRLPATPS